MMIMMTMMTMITIMTVLIRVWKTQADFADEEPKQEVNIGISLLRVGV